MLNKKQLSLYNHIELNQDDLNIYYEWLLVHMNATLNEFKYYYLQYFVDINNVRLSIGDIVYYVSGSSIKMGYIEKIDKYIIGYSEPLIYIKGKKKPLYSYSVVKI